jgi:hypothetical protein
VTWGALAVSALTLAMSLQSRRFITLFAVASSLVLAMAADSLLHRQRGPQAEVSAPPAPRAGRGALRFGLPLGLVIICAIVLRGYPWSTVGAFLYTTRYFTLPIDTLDFIEANGLHGRVFSYFLWGGYVDFRTQGRLEVFIDPRSETVFDAGTQRAFNLVRRMQPGWQRIIEGSGAEWVLWPRHSPLPQQLELSGRWLRLHQDAVSILLARTDLALPRQLVAAPDSPYREWAAAIDAWEARDLHEAERRLVSAFERLPDLAPACRALRKVESELGQEATARRTVERCRARGHLRELEAGETGPRGVS